ncbi:serine/threonine-protein kinase [Tahibacter aquaticus]|uniref:Serine/threonine-protein kinase n=1 Tax=Tahibacter aquaticus TaxID=520092 RepID=A0A4V3DMC3_9GAMM|nr:serine/threonine-protein kinase [Tahibacter aquaticus]TDR43860.1 serine/threonine-protein kinase [Tahibacter aquaticus]
MSNSTFQRVRHLFDILVELTPAQRLADLEARSDLDAPTRQLLHQLLQLDADTASLTAAPALVAAHRAARDWIGYRVGAYAITAKLGEGGMGSVFRAQRVVGNIDQQVAIKIAHRELLNESSLARLRLERQVLALLQHPNIAAMYDLGELDDGTPYIVMEYVQALPLPDYVAHNGTGLRERLQLFLQLCDAVAYAHRNLIVHRDIKPANVLVTDTGQPKLLDFGIAKPLQHRLGSVEIEQTHAAQRYFSLRNVAPEQLRGETVTVTCDVYGLGTVLYELLCGHPLYDLEGLNLTEVEQRISQDDPPPPSRRAAASNAALLPWQRTLAPDLDAIALFALRRDPQARYASVDALAADLHRYLHGYPVAARQGSRLYHAGRFLRRHRVALATSALFVAVIAVAGTLWLRQYISAQAERERAENVTHIIIDALAAVQPARARDQEISAREVFEQVGSIALSSSLDNQPATRTQLAAAVARIYLQLGLPREALTLIERIEGDIPQASDKVRFELETARAQAQLELGRVWQVRAALQTHAETARTAPERLQWRLLEAGVHINRGEFDQALALLQTVAAADSGAAQMTRSAARRLLPQVLLRLGRRDEAQASARELLSEHRSLYGDTHPELLATLNDVLSIMLDLDNYADAAGLAAETMTMSRHLYGENSLIYTKSLSKHATALAELGQLDRALDEARSSLQKIRALRGENAPVTASYHYYLALILERRGDSNAALEHFAAAARIGEASMSEHSDALYQIRFKLAAAQLQHDQPAAAGKSIDSALAMAERYPLVDKPDLGAVAQLIRALADNRLQPSAAYAAAVEHSTATAQAEARGLLARRTLAALVPTPRPDTVAAPR